jgi:hypothetical protein
MRFRYWPDELDSQVLMHLSVLPAHRDPMGRRRIRHDDPPRPMPCVCSRGNLAGSNGPSKSMNFRPKIFRAMASISSLAFVSGWMRLIFRVSSIAGLCLGLSRRRSLVRARFSRVHLAHKWTPKRTPSGGFSFPPDDDEEFRGGRGKRVNRPPNP